MFLVKTISKKKLKQFYLVWGCHNPQISRHVYDIVITKRNLQLSNKQVFSEKPNSPLPYSKRFGSIGKVSLPAWWNW